MDNTKRSPVGNPYKDAPKVEKSALEVEYDKAMSNKELVRSFANNDLTKILIAVIRSRREMLLIQLSQAPLDKVTFIQGEISQLEGILFILDIKA